MKQFLTLLAVLIVGVSVGFGSSVTKTVGVGQDYTTIADALADVNANGLADTVSLALMDTLYNETSLMYNPMTSQPMSLYMFQGGVAKPHVRVTPGGLPYAIMAVNHAEFVMYNIIVEPDVNSTWLAGVNVRSMENNSRVYIQSGGVTGSTTDRGYDVLADSSSEVNIFGCLVINVQSVGIYIELQDFAIASSIKNQTSVANVTGTSGVVIEACYISGSDTAISLNGIGTKFSSENTVTTQCDIGTVINSMGEGAEVSFTCGADTVMERAIYMPNGHNVGLFQIGVDGVPFYSKSSNTFSFINKGEARTASRMCTRRNMYSMQKLAAAKGSSSLSSSLSPNAIDVTINNDSTVLCDFSISDVDFDWVGTAVKLDKKFLGNSSISNNTFSVIGYASLPGMAINYSSGGILQATYDDEYNGNIVSHELGHNWLVIEFQNETGSEVFGGITARENTFTGVNSAMQLKSKRSEIPTNVDKVLVSNNDFTGNSIFEGIAFEFGDIDIKRGLRFDSNTVSNTNVAMQYRSKRSEIAPNLNAIKTAELSRNTISNVQVGFDFEFNPDSTVQANETAPLYPEILVQGNILSGENSVSTFRFVGMQYRAKRAEVPPNIDGIKIVDNTIDGNGGGTAFYLQFPTFNNIEIENNNVIDARYNLLLGALATIDYIGDRDWYGPPLSIENNTFTSSVDGAQFLQSPSTAFAVHSLSMSGNTANLTGGPFRINSFFDVFTDLSISDNNFRVDSFFDVFFDISVTDVSTVQIQNNNFTCTGGTSVSSVAGAKYELYVKRANPRRTNSELSGSSPDFSVLLSGNTFCEGDLIVDILDEDTLMVPMNVTITNNQADGNVTITSVNAQNDISGNTFNNSTAVTTSSMAGKKYELQVRQCRCPHRPFTNSGLNASGSSLLSFHNNTLNGFSDVVVDIEDTAGTASVTIDSNSVDIGTALSNSSMASSSTQVRFNKGRPNTTVSSMNGLGGSNTFSFTNNVFDGYSDVLIDLDDSSETLSAQLTGNSFTNTGSSLSSLAANRYEVSFRKSKTVTLATGTSSSSEPTTFDYSTNSLTGFEHIAMYVSDETGMLSTAFNSNLVNGGSASSSLKEEKSTNGMTMRKYELQVRASSRAQVQSSSVVGSTHSYSNNTVTGYYEVDMDFTDTTGNSTTSITGNTFTGLGNVATINQSPLTTHQTMMAGNKYQVGVKRGPGLKLGSNANNAGKTAYSVVGDEWFVYENNNVSGFSEGGSFDLENGGDAGTARLEGNTFGSVTVASNNVKNDEVLMAANKYEISYRRGAKVGFATVSVKQTQSITTGDSLIVSNNTFAGLDGGGLSIHAENGNLYYPLLVWVDANSLSSTSIPFQFDMSESPFDSGATDFLVTGNVIHGGTGSSNVESHRYNLLLGALSASSLQPAGYTPNTFTNGGGLAFYRNPVDSVIRFNYQNMSGNSMNIINGTNAVVDARYCWWGTTDSAEIASKMQGNVLFMPFLTDSVTTQVGGIAGVVYNDANFNYIRDSETGLEGWTVQLKVDGDVVDEQLTNANGGYYFQDIPFDQYTVWLVPQDGYAYSENLACGSVDFKNGTLFSVEFGVFSDSKKFRTFSADTLLSKKPVKIVFKSNVRTSLYPNASTALENVFTRLGKNGATFLGIAQSDKNRAKNLAWIPYKKAADLGKLYTSAHSGTAYPIDSLRPVGKPAKKLKGAVKADRKQFNNPLFAQGVAFNLNIVASAMGVTPSGFGELVYDSPGSLLGKKLRGMTLAQVADWMNQLMTNWDSLGVENSSAYAELGDFAMNVLKPLNDGFTETVDSSNSQIDTAQVTTGVPGISGGKKNPYAVTLKGVKTASDVGMVVYVPGNTPTVKIQGTGFSEDESTLPEATALMQNYPNPFNPSTQLSFVISHSSLVTLKVYNTLGQEMATLLNNEEVDEGNYELSFDASSLTSGVYFYRLTVNGVEDASQTFTDVKRMLLVK